MTLDNLRQLLDEATPGPWSTWSNGFDAGVVSDADGADPNDRYRSLIFGGEPHEGYIDPDDADARLVVALRNAAPDLLAAVEALERLEKNHALRLDAHGLSQNIVIEVEAAAWGNARAVLRRLRGEEGDTDGL